MTANGAAPEHGAPSGELGLDAYQVGAGRTALYPRLELPWIYPALGLSNEAGEVLGKLKKVIRDHSGEISDETREALADELGDVLWYVAMLAEELGLHLGEIGHRNLAKLADRSARDAIRGDGDKR